MYKNVHFIHACLYIVKLTSTEFWYCAVFFVTLFTISSLHTAIVYGEAGWTSSLYIEKYIFLILVILIYILLVCLTWGGVGCGFWVVKPVHCQVAGTVGRLISQHVQANCFGGDKVTKYSRFIQATVVNPSWWTGNFRQWNKWSYKRVKNCKTMKNKKGIYIVYTVDVYVSNKTCHF